MKNKVRILLSILVISLTIFPNLFVCGSLVSRDGNDKFLYDYADIILKNKDVIEKFLKDYREKTGIEFVVLTVNNIGGLNMDEYTTKVFQQWKIGAKNKGRGILLLISKDDRLIKFKISYELEDVIPYEFCEKIVEDQIVPYIDQGDLYAGIQGAIEGIINETAKKIDQGILPLHGEIEEELVEEAEIVSEIGGYERYLEMLGEQPRDATDRITYLHKEQRPYFAAQDAPEQAVEIFYQILENKITDPFLDVYTDGTKVMMYYSPPNSFQIENFYNMIKDGRPYTVKVNGNRAVILFNKNAKRSGPILLTKENGKWRIDLVWTNQIIVYDFQNNWRYRDCKSPYLFAFDEDYMVAFDGYPLINKYHPMYDAPVPNLFERIEKLHDFIDSQPDNYEGYAQLAEIYSKECFLIDIAIDLYKKAILLAPREEDLYCSLAWLYTHSLQYKKAIKQYKKELEFEEEITKYHYQRVADLYYELKEYSPAIEYYEKAISVGPHDKYSMRMIIRCLSRLGKFNEARKKLVSYKEELDGESYQKMENYISKWEVKLK